MWGDNSSNTPDMEVKACFFSGLLSFRCNPVQHFTGKLVPVNHQGTSFPTFSVISKGMGVTKSSMILHASFLS
jgi:hypothetical protein